MAAFSNPRPSAEAIAIASSRDGNARNRSVMRMMTSSIQPPLYPAIAPSGAPISTASSHDNNGYDQCRARAHDDPAEHIPPQPIGTKPMFLGRRQHGIRHIGFTRTFLG